MPELDRRVDEGVEVGRVEPEHLVSGAVRGRDRQRRRGPPASRRDDLDVGAELLLAFDTEKERRADEECVGLVDVVRSHGELAGVNPVAHDHAGDAAGLDCATRPCGSSLLRAGDSAASPSTCRAYSRTRYEPGVHTGMKRTIDSGRACALCPEAEIVVSTWTRCVWGAGIETR